MKNINHRMIPTVFLLLFASILNPAFGAQTNEAGLIDDAADKPSTALVQDLKKIPTAEAKTLFEESYFHRFIERAKNNLSTIGQRLTFVISKYAEIPAELAKALNHLNGGKGLGHLVKIILLFMLLIAIGFGAERLFNIFIKKHKQQLQSTIPDSFLQLIARLSARTVLELISLTVFALTIVGIYLLFYPAPKPAARIGHDLFAADFNHPPGLYFIERLILAGGPAYAGGSAELYVCRNLFHWIYDLYHYQPFRFKNPFAVKKPRYERRCLFAFICPFGPVPIFYFAGHTLDGSRTDYALNYENAHGCGITILVFRQQN